MIDSQAFNQQLADGNIPFAKTYLFFGKTPFLSEESAQLLVDHAKGKGFPQRELHYIDNRSKFQPILNSIQSPGLFDPKKIIELRFDTEKPTKKIGEKVAEIARHQSENIIIIQASALNYKAQKEKWFTDIQQLANTITSKPIYANQLPNWIHQRAQHLDVQLETEALKKILEYSEGNLLWTNQILMQLQHSDYEQPIKVSVIENMLADLSVFQIEDLTQAILNNNQQALKIVHKLEQENESLVFITSVLQRDIETLITIIETGLPASQAFDKLRIWKNKQRGYQAALNHYGTEQLSQTLRQLAQLDKINKGQEKGDGWLLLTKLISELVLS